MCYVLYATYCVLRSTEAAPIEALVYWIVSTSRVESIPAFIGCCVYLPAYFPATSNSTTSSNTIMYETILQYYSQQKSERSIDAMAVWSKGVDENQNIRKKKRD